MTIHISQRGSISVAEQRNSDHVRLGVNWSQVQVQKAYIGVAVLIARCGPTV
jgi:hypothetical protein